MELVTHKLYKYVSNNPLNEIDPLGLFSITWEEIKNAKEWEAVPYVVPYAFVYGGGVAVINNISSLRLWGRPIGTLCHTHVLPGLLRNYGPILHINIYLMGKWRHLPINPKYWFK